MKLTVVADFEVHVLRCLVILTVQVNSRQLIPFTRIILCMYYCVQMR